MSWQSSTASTSQKEEKPPSTSRRHVNSESRTSTTLHTQATSPSPRRAGSGLLSFRNFFGNSSKEKEQARKLESLVSNNGSISNEVWNALPPGNATEKRIEMMECIKQILRSRTLQVSTLEGVYHDMSDLLHDGDCREQALGLLVELTSTQYAQLGLALRHTFFEKIREMDCDELTLKWLNNLSYNGQNVNGFEKDMDYLVADWIMKTLSVPDHPQAVDVLLLTNNFITHNSAFISSLSMSDIVREVCTRGCRVMDPLTNICLKILSSVLKYSELPRDLLLQVISVFCIQACDPTFREQSWSLAKSLLNSQLGHRTRKHLQQLLESWESFPSDISEASAILLLRGAVFCLVNANWGISLVETVRGSPASVIPSLEIAMTKDVSICADVITSLDRLILKYGKDLQQMTWQKLLHLFDKAITLFEQKPEFAARCEPGFQKLLLMTEQLYKNNQFNANPEAYFDLIEKSADRRPDNSVISLIDYRTQTISPMCSDWIDKVADLVRRYGDDNQPIDRRSRVISALHSIYTRYSILYEADLVTKLVLPVFQKAASEKNPKIQYEMINVLFDVAKTVALRNDSRLFLQVFALIRQLLNHKIVSALPKTDEVEDATLEETESSSSSDSEEATVFTIDNLIVMAQGVGDVLFERWSQLSTKAFAAITHVLVEHIDGQYRAGWTGPEGHEVRTIVMNALLSIHCCPITKRLQLIARDDQEPRQNMFLRRSHESYRDGYSWSDICKTVTAVISYDTDWHVIKECLERLGRVLEHIEFVRTATEEQVDQLTQALVNLYTRSESGCFTYPDKLLAKFLPPVLATLLNYTSRQENKNKEICRVLVNCVRSEHMEALMAIDIAVQLVPSLMAVQAMNLIDHLKKLPATATRAIPLIEFMSDSAEIPEFHNFFQEKHFKMVVDILIPYTDVKKFNTYIVACVHRVLMRWYARVPDVENQRNAIRMYVEQKIRDLPLLSIADGMTRQHSGDGRQVPGHIFLLGGDPSTPPPMDGIGGFREERGCETIHDEIQRAMSSFFRLGKIEDSGEMNAKNQPPEHLTEASSEHYFINDCIVSVRKFVDWKEEDSENDVFSNEGDVGSPSEACTPNGSFLDQRRRHQSAVQGVPRRELQKLAPKAMDDIFTHRIRKNTLTKVTVPVLSFVQLSVRHMYGKSSWLMRSFEQWPADFERTASILPTTSSLMFHLVNMQGVIRLGKRGCEENLSRSFRNLDTVPGIEHHAVGVLFVGPNQTTESSIYANVYGSAKYSTFTKLLGDPIPLDKCPAGLEEERHGSYTYEYKDELSRIVFLIATLMPNLPKDPNCYSKKKLIANNFVSIVFNESGQPFGLQRMTSVCGQFAHVVIEVVPCDAQSVLVTVHAKQEISCWLAMKRVLLSYVSAARLIRKLVVRAQLSVNVWRSVQEDPSLPYISSGVQRLRKIFDIRDKMASSACSH